MTLAFPAFLDPLFLIAVASAFAFGIVVGGAAVSLYGQQE